MIIVYAVFAKKQTRAGERANLGTPRYNRNTRNKPRRYWFCCMFPTVTPICDCYGLKSTKRPMPPHLLRRYGCKGGVVLATAARAAPAKCPPPPARSKRNVVIVFPIIPGGGARLMKQIACDAVERIANKVHVAGFATVLARRIGFWPDNIKGTRHRGSVFSCFGNC